MNIYNLSSVIPRDVLDQVPEVMDKYRINSPPRLANFLGQCSHESWNFTATSEILNYSAAALRSVFGKYFPTAELAAAYARQPERIANVVYANRLGNGSELSGDGYRYRGRGYLQITGKVNYQAFNKVVPEDVVYDPSLVASKYPLLSAAWFWNSRSLNSYADAGVSDQTIAAITKRINGGLNGIDDRIVKTRRYYGALGS